MFARFFKQKRTLESAAWGVVTMAGFGATGYMVVSEQEALQKKHPDKLVVPKYNAVPGVGAYWTYEYQNKFDEKGNQNKDNNGFKPK